MAEATENTGFDYNKIIADIVVQNEERWIKGVKGIFTDKYKKAGVKYSFAFQEYLTRAYEKYSKIKTILYRNEPRFLYDFFVCNNIIQTNPGKKEVSSVSCSSVQNLMNTSKYLTILGSGGTGKSILMKHFFVNALVEKTIIPIFAELRNYSEKESLIDFIYRIVNSLGFNLELDYFEYALKSGSFLLLLDGYDEMNATSQKTFHQKIDEFCDRFPNNNIIISSRPCDDFFGWHRFSIYKTIPLTKEKAIKLVNRIDYDTEIKNKFLSRLNSDLYESHESFASNPLLLSIMLLTFDNFADIPQKRHIFYSNAFDTLYSIHDATKAGYKRNLKSNLSSEEFKKVFSCFCFITYLGATTEFTRDRLNACIDEIIDLPEGFNRDAFIEDLISSVCLLYLEGTNYVFTHKSFQEYFTALYLLQMSDDEQKNACSFLLDNCGNTLMTDSVFEMLSDMNPDRFEKNFVLPILEKVVSFIPNGTDVKKLTLQSFVNKVIILSIRDILRLKEDTYENIVIIPLLGFEKTDNVMCISFKKEIYPNFLFYLGNHYKRIIPSIKALTRNTKLPIKYFANEYSIGDVIRDPVLYNYLINIPFVDIVIATPVPLLEHIRSRLDQKKSDETRLFRRFLSIGKANDS